MFKLSPFKLISIKKNLKENAIKLLVCLILVLVGAGTVLAMLPRGRDAEIQFYTEKLETSLLVQQSLHLMNNFHREEHLLKVEEILAINKTIQKNKKHWNELQEDIEFFRCELGECPQQITGTMKFTSYNAEEAQTGSTPCVAGGTGYNVCDMAKRGERVIALSWEQIDWANVSDNAPFSKGDKVILKSSSHPNDPRCNGEFIVGDAMAKRWKNRGDIFMLDRKDNISCWAAIYK